MKPIAVLSGDKRQYYIAEYLNKNGYNAYIKTNFDFNDSDYIVCSTPLCKNKDYLNCDFYSSFPMATFIKLITTQTVFGGNIPEKFVYKSGGTFVDVLKSSNLVWENGILTAEGLIKDIIEHTDFSITHSNIFIMGFGNCGINIAKKLNALGGNITIYDHTKKHLDQAMAFGYDAIPYEEIVKLVEKFDIIINTVPSQELKQVHYEKISKNCVLFEIASPPYGLSKSIADKYHLSLFTCPGIPGKYSPKNAGELIAKFIISYLERTEINGSWL